MTDSLTARMGAYFGSKVAEVDAKITNVTNFITVQDVVARDLIPVEHRYDGLWVKVLSPAEAMFFLKDGITNDCWVDFLAINADGLPTPGMHSHTVDEVVGLGSAATHEASDFAPASLIATVAQIDAKVPSKLSQLANDTGFATTIELDARLNSLVDGAPAAIDTFREVASEIAADQSGLAALTAVVAGKANADLSNVGTLPASVKAQLKGDPGPQGPQGQQGLTGATGGVGANGSQWYSANTAPSEVTSAVVGDFILLTNGDIYTKTSSGYTKTGNIKGPIGATGAAGPAGGSGPQGPGGPQGPQGPTGGDAYSDGRFSPLLFNNKWDCNGGSQCSTWTIPAGVGRIFYILAGGGGGGGAASPYGSANDGWCNKGGGGLEGGIVSGIITRDSHPDLFDNSRTIYYGCGYGGSGQTTTQGQNGQRPLQNGSYASTSPYYRCNSYEGNGGTTFIGFYDHRGSASIDYFNVIAEVGGGEGLYGQWWTSDGHRYNDYAKLQAVYTMGASVTLTAAQSASIGWDGFAQKVWGHAYTTTGGAKLVSLTEALGMPGYFGNGGTPALNSTGGSAASWTGAGGAGGVSGNTSWYAGGAGGCGRVIIFY